MDKENSFQNRLKVDAEDKKEYRIYATGKDCPWELVAIRSSGVSAVKIAKGLDVEKYNHYVIIEHDLKAHSDFPYKYGFLLEKEIEKEEER